MKGESILKTRFMIIGAVILILFACFHLFSSKTSYSIGISDCRYIIAEDRIDPPPIPGPINTEILE